MPSQPARTPNPLLLGIIATMWIVVGVLIGVYVHAIWRFIPAIVACAIGLYFLRGAAGAYVQRMR